MERGLNGPILVTGASGQVGSAVVGLLSTAMPDVAVAAPGRAELNLASADSIRGYIRGLQPRWIVSCAAYTAVDAAETDVDAAFAANGAAPGILAEEAAKVGAGLIHFSTDYVFNGTGQRPWVETDPTGPHNVYGASKLAGEEAIAAVAANASLPYVILRTSWVYSGGGKNFVRTMLRLLSTRTEPLQIVADQHGAPTAAADLADAVLAIIHSAEDQAIGSSLTRANDGWSGVYHCAGAGETTWACLAEAIRDYLRLQHGLEPPEIMHVSTSQYPTPAARPLNSRLNCDKLADTFGVRLPHWQTSLASSLCELASLDLQPAQRR